jgi:formylglycine-generating enzyme required for sulfatase activity
MVIAAVVILSGEKPKPVIAEAPPPPPAPKPPVVKKPPPPKVEEEDFDPPETPMPPADDWKPDLNIGPGGIKNGTDGLPRLIAPFNPAEASQAQEAWAKHLGKKVNETLDLGDGVTLVLVLIPPGTFIMGDMEIKDAPPHPVEITKPFYLGKYEVTQKQFQRVMGNNPSAFAPMGSKKELIEGVDTSEHPVESVKWEETRQFCVRVGERSGLKGRGGLPSEAEWEFAYRAGTTTKFYFGTKDDAIVEFGNMSDAARKRAEPEATGTAKWDDGYPFTAPVGKFLPNAFGLFDMAGNANEWVQDWYGSYRSLPKSDPVQLTKQSDDSRVRRGGSWRSITSYLCAAYRSRHWPASRGDGLGFRVCFRLD